MQLGPTFHVYPGATHTRLAHSFGVFHIAKKMIRKLIDSDDCPVLSLEGTVAFLTAALFHDLGHFPYTHSLKELPLTKHEVLSGNMVISEPLSGLIRESMEIDPEKVQKVIDTTIPAENDREINFFRNILSGVLDPDKLDYLNRDAYFCGVPYGMQDIDFVISRIVPHLNSGIGITEQGIHAIENILFSKYLMYKTVYWHKTVRIATAMVKKAVYLALKRSLLSHTDFYGIDDYEFVSMFSKTEQPLHNLIEQVTHRELFKTAIEIDFNDNNPIHQKLTNVEERHQYERHIAEDLTSQIGCKVDEESVILDIPEPISFEIDLPILADGVFRPFSASGSVFSPPVVRGFTNSLRKIRLILSQSLLCGCGNVLDSIEGYLQ